MRHIVLTCSPDFFLFFLGQQLHFPASLAAMCSHDWALVNEMWKGLYDPSRPTSKRHPAWSPMCSSLIVFLYWPARCKDPVQGICEVTHRGHSDLTPSEVTRGQQSHCVKGIWAPKWLTTWCQGPSLSLTNLHWTAMFIRNQPLSCESTAQSWQCLLQQWLSWQIRVS